MPTSSLEYLTHFDHLMLRPFLQKILNPQAFIASYSLMRPWYLKKLAQVRLENARIEKKVKVVGINFANDLGHAAGLDKDGALLEWSYLLGAGFSVVGTVLSDTHTGNQFSFCGKKTNVWTPLPKSNSSINSLGLPSLGIDPVVENIKKFKNKYPQVCFPIGVSLMGHPLHAEEQKIQGILKCVEKLNPLVDFFEINESCPNVQKKTDGVSERIKEIRKATSKPIFVKLGDAGDVTYTVQTFTELNVNGLVFLNTQKRYADFNLDPADQKIFHYYTQKYQGGLGGKVIYSYSLQQLQKVRDEIIKQKSPLILIHVGGIQNKADVLESRKIAPLREWYTGLLQNMGEKKWRDIYREII
ncbi:MAG: hypothetical protein KBD63_06560 [Bacteriovoracaceae bacterium]|nr:hypothetical protein [Bacteriovoracaceae bacterium]